MFKSGYKLIEVAPGDSGDLGFTRWRLSRDSEFAGEADGFDLVATVYSVSSILGGWRRR